jgi:hypothetical protein
VAAAGPQALSLFEAHPERVASLTMVCPMIGPQAADNQPITLDRARVAGEAATVRCAQPSTSATRRRGADRQTRHGDHQNVHRQPE